MMRFRGKIGWNQRKFPHKDKEMGQSGAGGTSGLEARNVWERLILEENLKQRSGQDWNEKTGEKIGHSLKHEGIQAS